MLILEIFSKNIDFCQIFLKILALVEISKNLAFSQDFRKSRFLQKNSEIMSIFVKIFDDPEFSQNVRLSWFCSKFLKNHDFPQ